MPCRWTATPRPASPAYARAWDRLHRQPGQRGGALGRAALDVLGALLWVFHNARSGVCFPSYETIAEKAGCARSTVAEALKALEWAGVLTWQNRITRIRERCRDLFGRDGWRWRVIRTSNAYVFRDPKAAVPAVLLPSPTNGREHQNQELNLSLYRHQRLTQTARSSVPLPDSPQPSQQSKAANKPPVARTEPQNPAQERT